MIIAGVILFVIGMIVEYFNNDYDFIRFAERKTITAITGYMAIIGLALIIVGLLKWLSVIL